MHWRLGDAIGLREGEGARTFRLFALVLSLMTALVFAKAAQRGLFLAAYPRSAIPDAFVLSALSLAGASFVVSAFAARLGPTRLLLALLPVVAGAFVLGWAALSWGHDAVPLGLYVLVEVAAGVLVVQGWTTVSTAVDVRSAKRLLPLVGNAAGIAWTLGGLATAGIVAWLGTESLLLLAAALLIVCALVVRAVERHDLGGRAARGARGTSLWAGARDGLRYTRSHPLLRALAILTVAGLLAEQLLDYILFATAQHHYAAQQDQITAFMGMFFAITGGIALLAQLTISGRVLSRFGSPSATLAEFAAVLIGSVVFFLFPGFAIIVAVRGAHRICRQTLCSPARAQMQTTIPPVRRAQAGALLKGVLAPLFYAGGGMALKLLPPTLALRWLSVPAAVLAVIAAAVTIGRVRRAYVEALRRSVDRRSLDLGIGRRLRVSIDREHCAAIIADLRSDDPGRAAFAASLLAAAEPSAARLPLREACTHTDRTVRVAAVDTLAGVGDASDAPAIAAALHLSSDAGERQACIRALAAFDVGLLADALRDRADDGEPRTRALIWACEARAGDDRATAALVAMLEAESVDERAAAAWAAGEIRVWSPELRGPFVALFGEPALHARTQAVQAAGRIGDPMLAEPLVAALAAPDTASTAIAAIAELDDEAIDHLDRAARTGPVGPLCRLATALATGSGPRGDAFLTRLVAHDHRVVRYRAARALSARRRSPSWRPPPAHVIAGAVRAEVRTGYGYYALLVGIARTDGIDDFDIEPEYAFIADEIRLRIRQTERRLFALLDLVADRAAVGGARVSMRRGGPKQRARAVELLEHTLDAELAELVIPFVEPLPLRLRLARLRGDLQIPESYQRDPLAGIMSLNDPHLQRCATLSYRERLATEYPEQLEEHETMLPLMERIYFLRRVPMFRDLSAEDVTQVALIAEQVEFPAGHVIFHKDDPGDVLYLVMHGRVAVRAGGLEIATIGANEFFGELAVLDDEPRSADAVCTEDSELLRIAGPDLEELLERRPAIAREIIRVLARRLRVSTERLSNAS